MRCGSSVRRRTNKRNEAQRKEEEAAYKRVFYEQERADALRRQELEQAVRDRSVERDHFD